MIEHKLLNIGDFKTTKDLENELDKLANYEGWVFVGMTGKKNNLMVLKRLLEYQEPVQVKKKGGRKIASAAFPDAVYQ